MTENTFFNDWTNRKIDFGRGPSSMWTLDRLYGEKNSQVDDERYYEYQCIGSAYGTFLCQNVMDSTSRGVMKIFMQDCVNSGIVRGLHETEHVLWDAATYKSYITSFRMSGPAGESDEWRDDELIVWSMAQTQNNRIWFEDPNKHPDMSTWTL
ncbi:hypothetical protein AO1008_07152 [Aspergillus oryzae 100-8]|nr:hypothetical protein Ao3042_02999 [Aspergillus oryzae 3.042]KDE80714.1 hypothetical protein AO1008_07152 [Aspergillus oryzae 100-8]|eukprot:EIT80663.1 hypothetical protein Ao3042_02999 [Aspergillus oryzae 3.042]